jgi:hypothetical protein
VSATVAGADAVARALERAATFVHGAGEVLASARLDALLGRSDASSVLSLLSAWRCADGGFAPLTSAPPRAGAGGTLQGTLAALGVLDELNVRSGELAEGAAAWLGATQASDGGWHPLPPDPLPAADAVVLSGLLAGHLAKLLCGSPRTLSRAEQFLAAQFAPERVEDVEGLGLAAYAHICANGAEDLADEALQWCGRALEKGFRRGTLGPLAVARALLLADARSLPGGRVEAGEVVLALLTAQDADGGFGGGAAIPERVESTLLAVRALLRFGCSRPAAASPPSLR